MKKISTIAIAMSALLLVSAGASAQQFPSRHMERRSQANQNDQYAQRNERLSNSSRPRVSVSFSIGSYGGYGQDHSGYNRHHRGNYRHNNYRHSRYQSKRYCRPSRRSRY